MRITKHVTVHQPLLLFTGVGMASLLVVRTASRKLTFKHSCRYVLAFVFRFERGSRLIMVILCARSVLWPSFLWNKITCKNSACWKHHYWTASYIFRCFEKQVLCCMISQFPVLIPKDKHRSNDGTKLWGHSSMALGLKTPPSWLVCHCEQMCVWFSEDESQWLCSRRLEIGSTCLKTKEYKVCWHNGGQRYSSLVCSPHPQLILADGCSSQSLLVSPYWKQLLTERCAL